MTDPHASDADNELMLRFQAGDERAFETLLLKYQRRVLNVIYRYLGDRALAEDAAQEVFLKVYRARASWRPEAKFSTWLYRIATNHCLNEIRSRRAALAPIDDRFAETVPHAPDENLQHRDLEHAVKKAIEALPENQRIAVILSRYEELSYEEIAASMQLSLEAVKSLLFRAKESLKLKLARFVSRDPS